MRRRWELDHYEPVGARPDLALVVPNFRAAHALCNRRRAAEGSAGVAPATEDDDGSGEVFVELTSEDW